ncbi:hypothetical protein F5X68DRAFT_264460 [Plectosphaerella plurivora]|uniref:Uncharacterized protein n=1 Tax=Plectosphaerella plurivora TaxID=936078 RepID=A0A9P9A7C0_9PEZI|nr:hypothetical protein F5X68DRAFT_264460 [Plectosphaerella plurivora]
MRYSLPILTGLAALPSGVLSAAVTDMTMLWPKPHYENTTDYSLFVVKQGEPEFPCRSVSPPANVERVPWPIGGARIKLLRTSTLWNRTQDIDDTIVGLWQMKYSFGQFQGLDVEDVENPVFDLDREEWLSGDFEIGGWCTKRTDIVDHVVEDGTVKSRTNRGTSIKKSDLEGVNATLGFYISNHFEGNVIAHTQCVYVQFTSDAPKGPCKKASTLPSDKEDDGGTYIYPDGFYDSSEPRFTFNATGLIVGLVVAFILVAAVVCCCIRSRKKSRARAIRPAPSRVEDIELQYPKPPTNPDDEQLPAYSGPPPRYNTGIGPAGAGAVPAAAAGAPAGAPAPAATTTATNTGGGAAN